MCPCWLWIRGYHAEIRKLGLNRHLDGKNGQEIGSDGSNQRVKLEVGWGVSPCLKGINASFREILGNKVVCFGAF